MSDPRDWRVDPDTIGGALIAAAKRRPERTAFIFGERRASYAGLLDDVLHRARGLIGAGVAPGDHIGVLMPNAWDSIILFYACALVGACCAPLNARYRRDDLAYAIPKADLKLLVIGGQDLPGTDFRAMLSDIAPDLSAWRGGDLHLAWAPRLRSICNFADARERDWPTESALDADAARISLDDVRALAERASADDTALMIFSSGTTAQPKACMLAHRSLTRAGRALAQRFAMTEKDVFWDPLPFFHMSTMLPLAACCAAGAAFIGVAHVEAGEALREMERERVTIAYPVFPTITAGLIAHPDFSARDLSRLRVVVDVGPPDLLRRYAAALPQAVHVSCYGLTEATGVPFYNELTDTPEQRFETGGRPFDGVEVRIADPASGQVCAAGERGEIWLRGWCVFKGYYEDEQRTREVITRDGWLRTGDMGALRDGRIVYLGRFKDMLKIGGENVAAQEIESFLMTHPAVQLAQVIGVPDERLMEVAAAFVELRDGMSAAAEDIAAYCVGRIASYKIPRYVRFVSEWPISATKIQKFRLLDSFAPTDPIDVRALSAAARPARAAGA